MQEFINPLINVITVFVSKVGYLGIFFGMFLESTMIPIPSELVMIPAGISASRGVMNIYAVIFVGVLGNVLGAIFSYYLALFLGRKILLKIGKYLFIKQETIVGIEKFFKKHGSISIFIGRLLPGFRHFISLPAGVATMDFKIFVFYTFAGSLLWTTILSMIGYLIGENQHAITKNLDSIAVLVALFCILLVAFYMLRKPVRK